MLIGGVMVNHFWEEENYVKTAIHLYMIRAEKKPRQRKIFIWLKLELAEQPDTRRTIVQAHLHCSRDCQWGGDWCMDCSYAVLCLVAQSCPALCDSMYRSPPGSSVHGILQARVLDWVAMPSSSGPSQPWGLNQVSGTAGGPFTIWATREAQEYWSG